jgi:hypothetical protein
MALPTMTVSRTATMMVPVMTRGFFFNEVSPGSSTRVGFVELVWIYTTRFCNYVHGYCSEERPPLMCSLVKNYPFVDDNKRAAATATGLFCGTRWLRAHRRQRGTYGFCPTGGGR